MSRKFARAVGVSRDGCPCPHSGAHKVAAAVTEVVVGHALQPVQLNTRLLRVRTQTSPAGRLEQILRKRSPTNRSSHGLPVARAWRGELGIRRESRGAACASTTNQYSTHTAEQGREIRHRRDTFVRTQLVLWTERERSEIRRSRRAST